MLRSFSHQSARSTWKAAILVTVLALGLLSITAYGIRSASAARPQTLKTEAVSKPAAVSRLAGGSVAPVAPSFTDVNGRRFGPMKSGITSLSSANLSADVPDFVSVLAPSTGAVAGYIPRSDMFETLASGAVIIRPLIGVAVYGPDGSTVVGKIGVGGSFVANGQPDLDTGHHGSAPLGASTSN